MIIYYMSEAKGYLSFHILHIMRLIVGITGASGAIYAHALVKNLKNMGHEIHLIISENGRKIVDMEIVGGTDEIIKYAHKSFSNDDLAAAPSSGTSAYDAMIIVPCSMSTLCKISSGIGDTLICRAAAVMLKEHKKLIIVPRETPLSSIHIECMLRLSQSGAIILPAMPAFYMKPKSIDDLVNYIVAKILDAIGISNDLSVRWDTMKDFS